MLKLVANTKLIINLAYILLVVLLPDD